jgi:hypothetical protein
MMQLELGEAGALSFHGISPLHADTLMRIPTWIESDDERVRERLLPRVYDDPEEERQWRQYGASGLEHLFASRAALIGRDLQTLEQDGPVTFALRIPRTHANAWLSSLNAARLALFALHDFEDADMERDPADLDDPAKELALVRIHLLALMQDLMIEAGA